MTKHISLGIGVLILAVGAGIGAYAPPLLQALPGGSLVPRGSIAQTAGDIVEEVGVLIILPTGETPTVATVADPDALKGQPFFVNAETGDKVLIFTKAGEAILYRPSARKIVQVAPLNVSTGTSTPPAP
jgi:hypothetical protein